MTTLFDSARSVKSARKPLFGSGLSLPRAQRLPLGPSPEDAAWWAYESNKDRRDYEVVTTAEDRHYDRRAAESREMDLICRGIVLA